MTLEYEGHFYFRKSTMPDAPNINSQHLFIVRMWAESSQTVTTQWRGSVEHVPSGERLYFVSLRDLTDFVTWRLNRNPPPSVEK
jgi:hypothetical protein